MLNKKGSGMLILLFSIGLFIVIAALFMESLNSDNDVNRFSKNFGAVQAEIINSYYNTESNLFLLDQSIKYSIYRTTSEFGDNAGYSKDNLCEKKDGFVVIDFKDCNPDLSANYIELFKKHFGKEVKTLEISENSIILEMDEIKYEKKGENFEIVYNVPNKFKQDVLLDLTFLNELKNRVDSCVERKQNLKECVGVDFTEKDGYAFFTIENDKNGLMILEGEVVTIKKPVFKFAVKND